MKMIESRIVKAKEAIKEAEKLLNKATTEQVCEEFRLAGEEILQVLVKHFDWMEDSKDLVFEKMEIRKGMPCLGVSIEYRQ